MMGLWETTKKVGQAVAKGTATYLEHQSRSTALHSNNISDEQREEMEDFADRMHSIRESLEDD